MTDLRTFLRNRFLDFFGNYAKPNNFTHFLNGHYVFDDDRDEEFQRATFRSLLQELAKYSQLCSSQDALRQIRQTNRSLISFTFDDGFEDCYTVIAPVLAEFDCKALFFVNPFSIGTNSTNAEAILRAHYNTKISKKFMQAWQVRALADQGHIIGSHTTNHLRLDINDVDELRSEVIESKQMVENLSGRACDCFAFPFGRTNDLSLDALRIAQQGYQYIFSSHPGKDLFTFDGQVINRRHFEGNWKFSHVQYFLSMRGK